MRDIDETALRALAAELRERERAVTEREARCSEAEARFRALASIVSEARAVLARVPAAAEAPVPKVGGIVEGGALEFV